MLESKAQLSKKIIGLVAGTNCMVSDSNGIATCHSSTLTNNNKDGPKAQIKKVSQPSIQVGGKVTTIIVILSARPIQPLLN
jgi:hypothetical protein